MTTQTDKCGIVRVGNVDVQLLAAGDVIVRMMRNGKDWEPETRAIWRGLIFEDRVVVDVGAYTGVYSIASVLMGARALAIEPHPANFRRLKANAAINSVKIEALWMAAGDKDEICALGMDKPADEINDIAEIGNGLLQVPIVMKRIDELQFRARICLIKIDVEHYEVNVLLGALRTIMMHKPFVLVETLSSAETLAVTGMLSAVGYTEARVLDQRNRLYVDGGNLRSV